MLVDYQIDMFLFFLGLISFCLYHLPHHLMESSLYAILSVFLLALWSGIFLLSRSLIIFHHFYSSIRLYKQRYLLGNKYTDMMRFNL